MDQQKNPSRVAEFWAAPDAALFDQKAVAQVISRSEAWCERTRHIGGGPKFLKLGGSVRYQKSDVVQWLSQFRAVSSTAEYQ